MTVRVPAITWGRKRKGKGVAAGCGGCRVPRVGKVQLEVEEKGCCRVGWAAAGRWRGGGRPAAAGCSWASLGGCLGQAAAGEKRGGERAMVGCTKERGKEREVGFQPKRER